MCDLCDKFQRERDELQRSYDNAALAAQKLGDESVAATIRAEKAEATIAQHEAWECDNCESWSRLRKTIKRLDASRRRWFKRWRDQDLRFAEEYRKQWLEAAKELDSLRAKVSTLEGALEHSKLMNAQPAPTSEKEKP